MKRVSALWTKDKVRSECRITGHSDPFVTQVSYVAQECTAHSAYVAIHGTRTDGHTFIDTAMACGARVIIHERPLEHYRDHILYIQHPNARRVASLFSRNLAGSLPDRIIGITGTDGKSTTCAFLHHLLRTALPRCALLSTVSIDDGTGIRNTPHRQSTPEVSQLYPFLAQCKAQGTETVILEATSHGLSTRGARLIDIEFSGAIITNISSEHLEFHGTREQYVDAKLNLVRQVRPGGWIVVASDFPYLDRVVAEKHPSVDLYTYTWTKDPVPNGDGLIARSIQERFNERTVHLSYRGMTAMTTLPYGPECYTLNMLGALLGTLATRSVSFSTAVNALDSLPQVSGRFELVDTPLPITVIMDFAHTEQSFVSLFSHIRRHHRDARIIALFGAAGERDRSKRAPLGQAAATWCDVLFLTDEDPRGEPPGQILDDIEQGIRLSGRQPEVQRIHERKEAISAAIHVAREGDILLLLAKSHERTIQYADHTIEWNEKQVVMDIARRRGERDAERDDETGGSPVWGRIGRT